MKIYVGNLSWETDTEGLKAHFEQFGGVSDAVETISGRAPRSLSNFVQGNLANFGAPGQHG